uniref:Peptidase_M13 domain-containing protein n=4 Tax=Bursaphelenchus xylophilus TaxID=6326 RepID=A0A1I7SN16_BURXY
STIYMDNHLIYFFFGAVDFPDYDVDFPASLDFSGTGFLMAKALSETYGTEFLKSDKDPDKEHRARWDCITKLYRQECDAQELCVLDQVAAHVGIRLAYSSYFALGNMSEPRLIPQFSNKQLFFINLAQTLRVWSMYRRLPDPVRVWGSIANFKGFAEAFGCPVGSKYNLPADKRCNIFDFDVDSPSFTTTTTTTTTT